MKLTFEIDTSLHREFKVRCTQRGVTMGSEIARLIRAAIADAPRKARLIVSAPVATSPSLITSSYKLRRG